MGSGIRVVQKTVEELFQLPAQYIYKVPEYQRPFSWNKDTAEEFISDMIGCHKFNEGGLFIGALIFVDNKKDSCYEIVDGQQRLLNLTVLLSVIRDLYRKFGIQDKIVFKKFDEYFARTVVKDREGLEMPILQPEDANRKFFSKYIQCPDFDNNEPKIWNLKEKANKSVYDQQGDANKIIIDTYHIYRKEILGNLLNQAEDDDDSSEKLIDFYTQTLLTTECAILYVEDEDKADEIFQAINSKRVQLTTADQIKSKIFSNYKRNGDEGKLEQAKGYWRDIQDILEKSGTLDEKTFVTYYWASEYGYVSNRRIFKEAKKEFDSKDNDYGRDFKKWSGFLEELHSCAEDLENIMHPYLNTLRDTYGIQRKDLVRAGGVPQHLNALNSFNNKTWHVLLFSLFRNLRESKYRTTIKTKLDYLVDFTFLYFDLMKEPSNWYFDIMHTAAYKIDKICDRGGSNKEIEREWLSLQRKLLDYVEHEDLTEEKFMNEFLKNVRYKTGKSGNSALFKYILGKIEHDLGNDDLNLYNEQHTVEHILPQDPKPWKLKKVEIKRHVNQIGNLVILSEKNNIRAQNKIFSEKLEVYKTSTFSLVKELVDNKEEWDFSRCSKHDFAPIEQRSEMLIQRAYKIWYKDLKQKLRKNISQ